MPTFLSKCILFGKALTTVALSCCDGKTTENMKHKVCLLVERGGQKSQNERVLAPGRMPPRPGSRHPRSPLRMSYFSMFPFVSLQQNVPVCQQTDRLYKSLIVTLPHSSLDPPLHFRLRDCLLQLWDEICIYSFQNKQTSVDWLFCTLVVL